MSEEMKDRIINIIVSVVTSATVIIILTLLFGW